jgi:hypothetical protein
LKHWNAPKNLNAISNPAPGTPSHVNACTETHPQLTVSATIQPDNLSVLNCTG